MNQTAQLFSGYLDNGSESLVIPIIRRHETLSIANQELLHRLGCLEDEVEQSQQQLHSMKQEHTIKKLVRSGLQCSYSVQHLYIKSNFMKMY